ncbi:MAG TPA: NF038122 family metalloprotease [Bryobacteraceae bacterium]|nr:NF038122 family metalloprotease [Bryobacteraceae bacterium]
MTYQCDPNTISQGLCESINNTVGVEYSQLFTNANASVYIQMGHLSSAVGHNDQFYTTVHYSDYYDALKASASGVADAQAVASLPAGGPFATPINAGYQVALTSALDAALGFTGAPGICKPGATNCSATGCALNSSTSSTCFNALITISDSKQFYFDDSASYPAGAYDFFTVVRHETDEVLGTGSCIRSGTLFISSVCLNGVWGTSAADLFRYVAPGQRGFSIGPLQSVTLSGQSAYFSIDGGKKSIAGLSSSPGGDDYGDLSTVCQHVQDSFGCTNWSNRKDKRGPSLTNDGGAEIAMLDAIGYQLTDNGRMLSAASSLYTPEPSSIGLVSVGFGLSGAVWRRRKRGC